jgi:diacylglycerol kinase (ATP)
VVKWAKEGVLMRFLLLYNPVSGRAKFKGHLKQIVKKFKSANLSLDVYESKAPLDLKNKAAAESENYDVFLVGGGDGTVNEVVNGMMTRKQRPAIAILPYGTANDIASILGVPKNINRALKMFFKETPVLMDINKLNDKFFVYTFAAGIFTRVSYDVSRRMLRKYGYLAYLFEGMKDFMHDYRFDLDINFDGNQIKNEYIFALGMSSNRVGGMTLANLAKSKLNDGLFELRLFESRRRFRRFRVLSFFLRRGKKLREDVHLVANKYMIQTDPLVSWNVDGELAAHGNIEVEVLKEQIFVYTSSKVRKKYF